jgi:hypothetical protein
MERQKTGPAEELLEMAHVLAWETATSSIDTCSVTVREDGETWHEIDRGYMPALAQCLRYLDLRGALVRHRHHRNWVQVGEPAAVAYPEVTP